MDQIKFVEGRPYHLKFFKGCLPQILLGPFLNILTHMTINKLTKFAISKTALK